MKRFFLLAFATIAALPLLAKESFACACGCGVFDVATSALLPTQEGGLAFIEYDFMNQNKNWRGTSHAPVTDNDDKDIKTHMFTAGAKYMFNRTWGAEISVPYWDRHFSTTDDTTGSVNSFNHAALGDVRLQGIYSGFSADMSSGITFGVKLPTGDYHYHGFDRDTAIGSGSTDLLLGGYRTGKLITKFNWFANATIDLPVLVTAGYRPGAEAAAVTGVYYNGWNIAGVQIAPVAQVIGLYRLHNRGLASDRDNSGYTRALLSPGLEIDAGAWQIYGDAGFPVYEHVKGNQLVASALFKLNISHRF